MAGRKTAVTGNRDKADALGMKPVTRHHCFLGGRLCL